MTLHLLTDEDVEILREMKNDYRNRRIAEPKRAYPEEEGHQAPECYVAWPPEGGIPALTAVGDVGPDGGNDRPGSATCGIYIINDTGVAELQPIVNFDRTVYNLTNRRIPQGWIAIQRTKYGKWLAIVERHQARYLKFSATENFTSGEANVTVDGVTYYDGDDPEDAVTSVENPGWAGLDNDEGIAFLNANDSKYYILSMITVATDIMVGHRIDDSNNKKFETLWQQFYMRAAETTTSDWRTDHIGADCS